MIESRWSDYAANAKERWGRLSREQIEATRGDRDMLSVAAVGGAAMRHAAAESRLRRAPG